MGEGAGGQLSRLPKQAGQAMLEYALISLTVVAGFALAYNIGFADFWTKNLNDSVNNYYITFPTNCTDGVETCLNHITDIAFQYQHR